MLYVQYVNKQFVTIFKTRNMQHPCIGYFLDPKCKVKSATIITDIVWGGKGREITHGSPILPNKYEALNVASSVMCVHVCALMSTQCLPDDTFISNVHIDLLLSGCSLALFSDLGLIQLSHTECS